MQSAWAPDAGNNDAARVMHAAGRDYLMSCDRIYAKSVKGPKGMWMRDRDMITNERFEGCCEQDGAGAFGPFFRRPAQWVHGRSGQRWTRCMPANGHPWKSHMHGDDGECDATPKQHLIQMLAPVDWSYGQLKCVLVERHEETWEWTYKVTRGRFMSSGGGHAGIQPYAYSWTRAVEDQLFG